MCGVVCDPETGTAGCYGEIASRVDCGSVHGAVVVEVPCTSDVPSPVISFQSRHGLI